MMFNCDDLDELLRLPRVDYADICDWYWQHCVLSIGPAVMEAVGSEVGLKMRSAIKAKLMELGCYVDDELPDYVMVMVANKRTRSQMEEDLQLFLSANTEAFVSWLHQVLQKLQEVTINTKLMATEIDKKSKAKTAGKKDKKDTSKSKDKNKTKDKKSKKDKSKRSSTSEEPELIRPNIPRLLMNLEKNSEPSITDIFAGQILKSHGIITNANHVLDASKEDEEKVKALALKARFPIIDPTTISINDKINSADEANEFDIPPLGEIVDKPTEAQKDVDSDGDDFINIATEADDLIGIDDETTSKNEKRAYTPPITSNIKKRIQISMTPPSKPTDNSPKNSHTDIELKKKSLKDRIGVREQTNTNNRDSNRTVFERTGLKSAVTINERSIKSRLSFKDKRLDDRNRRERNDRWANSRTLSAQSEGKSSSNTVNSIVRAPPRPNLQGISAGPQLLLRAMADAHKSLLNMPPKLHTEVSQNKKPIQMIRRTFNPRKIIIEVPSDDVAAKKTADSRESNSDFEIDMDTESLDDLEGDNPKFKTGDNGEYIPEPVMNRSSANMIISYVPTHIDGKLRLEDQKNNPQFVVTLDGLDPNIFLEKKLESIKDNEGEATANEEQSTGDKLDKSVHKSLFKIANVGMDKSNDEHAPEIEIKPSNDVEKESTNNPAQNRKRKASPIIFDKEKPSKSIALNRSTNEQNKYDSLPSHKQRSVSAANRERCRFFPDCRLGSACEFYHPSAAGSGKAPVMCRAFPACTFGDKCIYVHPPCKFDSTCIRKDCPYSHSDKSKGKPSPNALPPSISSHVVASTNYKSITTQPLPPICKFHPNCTNTACGWYHPKPCRFGKFCLNKVECNFYHHNMPSLKWKNTQTT